MLTVACFVAVLPILANSVVGFTEPEIRFTGSEVYGDAELDYSYEAECLFVDLKTGEEYPCSFITEENPLECGPGTAEECVSEEDDWEPWEPMGEWRFDEEESEWYYDLDPYEEEDLNYSGEEEDVEYEDWEYLYLDEEEEEDSSWYTSEDASHIEEETSIVEEEEDQYQHEDPEAMYFASVEDREDASYCYEMGDYYGRMVEEVSNEEEEEVEERVEDEEQTSEDLLRDLKNQFNRLLEKGYLKNSDKIQALLNGDFDHILVPEEEPTSDYCAGMGPTRLYPVPEYCGALEDQYYEVPKPLENTEYCDPLEHHYYEVPKYCEPLENTDLTNVYPLPPYPSPYYPNSGEEFGVSVVEEFLWEGSCVAEKRNLAMPVNSKRNLAMPVDSEEIEEENRVLFQIRDKTYAVESVMDFLVRDFNEDWEEDEDFDEENYDDEDSEDYYNDDYYYDDYTDTGY